MVNTSSRTARNIPTEADAMDRYSDDESEGRVPDVLTRNQINDFNTRDIIFNRNDSEMNAVNQRFCEMNKQISDLRSLSLNRKDIL